MFYSASMPSATLVTKLFHDSPAGTESFTKKNNNIKGHYLFHQHLLSLPVGSFIV